MTPSCFQPRDYFVEVVAGRLRWGSLVVHCGSMPRVSEHIKNISDGQSQTDDDDASLDPHHE